MVVAFSLVLLAAMYARESFVLWDKANDQPIEMASVYTTSNGTAQSTFSDRQGRVNVNFTYDSLTVSYMNYRRVCLKALPDTLFMEQSFRQLPEVVVSPGAEPEWIRPLLVAYGVRQDQAGKI